MQKTRRLLIKLTFFAALVACLWFGIPWLARTIYEIPPPVAKSEVPVAPLIFSYRSVEDFQVLSVEPGVRPPLRIGIAPATLFVLQCRIRLTARGEPGSKPFVKAVESSYRCVQRGDLHSLSIADVELSPLIGLKEDVNYDGSPIELTTTTEEVVSTMALGENRYLVRAGQATGTLAVYHDKTGSRVMDPPKERKLRKKADAGADTEADANANANANAPQDR